MLCPNCCFKLNQIYYWFLISNNQNCLLFYGMLSLFQFKGKFLVRKNTCIKFREKKDLDWIGPMPNYPTPPLPPYPQWNFDQKNWWNDEEVGEKISVKIGEKSWWTNWWKKLVKKMVTKLSEKDWQKNLVKKMVKNRWKKMVKNRWKSKGS